MKSNPIDAIKTKLGLKGETKPGEMITRMNKMKESVLKAKVGVKEIIKKII